MVWSIIQKMRSNWALGASLRGACFLSQQHPASGLRHDAGLLSLRKFLRNLGVRSFCDTVGNCSGHCYAFGCSSRILDYNRSMVSLAIVAFATSPSYAFRPFLVSLEEIAVTASALGNSSGIFSVPTFPHFTIRLND